MKYPVAEKFKAPQGEGLYCGTPMAFIRLVGCSVGKHVCHACDTEFDKTYDHRGGGMFTPEELLEWVGEFKHICITGGEPLDRDLTPLFALCYNRVIHIESSGTVDWIIPYMPIVGGRPRFTRVYLTISPKPGYLEKMIQSADEIKVILDGLGTGAGWPTVDDARRWAQGGKLVYIQPRNAHHTIEAEAMADVVHTVLKYPELRLSAQLHKYIGTR